jgi:ornithine cyclodeaminase/alanine dehydrogenase-like protein (mu-crystallin family)
MATVVLTQAQIQGLLSMQVCMELMEEALTALARGAALNPLRTIMRLADGNGLLGMMPGSLESRGVFGLKVIGVLPKNHGTEHDSHQGLVLLFDSEHGLPRAILDASEITAVRTAATSGLATRLLAREDAGDLAILGTGVQAASHLEAMLCARRLRRVRVFSPTRSRLEEFAARASRKHGLRVEPMESVRAAVDGADLICTVTTSLEPILLGDWLAPGSHVNAVGACTRNARELDSLAVQRSRLFVDRRESVLNEAGDFLIPKSEGVFADEHIRGELGDVLLGRSAGRRSADEITLFKSLGIAVEDLVVASHLERVAREQGVGTYVELGGRRRAAD